MAQLLRKKCGRPLKHENGWEGVNRQICISNTTFSLWRDVREELGLHAHFIVGRRSGLLPCYTTDISFTAFICNSPCGKPCRFP